MLDQTAATLALRNRALSLVVATTGSQTLSATANGYARSSGSFLADGFADGMEFVPFAFSDVTPKVIESVTALSIVTTTATTAQGASAGRSLTVGFPATQSLDNRRCKPIAGRPYTEEEFVPGPSRLLSAPAAGGEYESTGLYIIKIYGLSDTGIGGIRKMADALLALFTPGTKLTAGAYAIRPRGDTAAWAGQILPQGNGWSVCSVTVPWVAYSTNMVAA
jgi:hypothetical protein